MFDFGGRGLSLSYGFEGRLGSLLRPPGVSDLRGPTLPTGVPRPPENAHHPRTPLGPWAQAYGRVLGGAFFYERGTPVLNLPGVPFDSLLGRILPGQGNLGRNFRRNWLLFRI